MVFVWLGMDGKINTRNDHVTIDYNPVAGYTWPETLKGVAGGSRLAFYYLTELRDDKKRFKLKCYVSQSVKDCMDEFDSKNFTQRVTRAMFSAMSELYWSETT